MRGLQPRREVQTKSVSRSATSKVSLTLPIVILLNPKSAIKGPVLDRFADVFARDLVARLEISDGARNFQDTVVSASAQIHAQRSLARFRSCRRSAR